MRAEIESKDPIVAATESIRSARSYQDSLTILLDVIRQMSGCESAMVRVFSEKWIPVHACTGMSPRFLRDESVIPAVDCMCGRVARADTDPSLFFFTEGGSFLTNDVDLLLEQATDEELGPVRGRCIAEGFKTIAAVPILHASTIVGVVHLASKRKEQMAGGVIEALESLCSQVGEALVSEGFEHERRQKLMASLTDALLPAPPPTLNVLQLGLAHRGASAPEALGGDFYDVVDFGGDKTGLFIGDFAGHGIGAAGLAAQCRFMLHRFLMETTDPAETLRLANEELADALADDKFSTAAVLLLDAAAGRARISLAGHPAPIILEPGGWVRYAEACSLPLGVSRDTAYDATEVEFPAGAALVVFTDGLTDSRNDKGQRFGRSHVAGLCRTLSYLPPQELAEGLCRASDNHSSKAEPEDDKLVIVAKRGSA